MSGEELGRRVGGDLEIVRGTLCQILRNHLGEVEILFGDTIQGITQFSNSALKRSRSAAPEAVNADTAGTRYGVAYQALHRADQNGGQRNFPKRLLVLLRIKRNAGMMTGAFPRAALFFLFTFAFFFSATAR